MRHLISTGYNDGQCTSFICGHVRFLSIRVENTLGIEGCCGPLNCAAVALNASLISLIILFNYFVCATHNWANQQDRYMYVRLFVPQKTIAIYILVIILLT